MINADACGSYYWLEGSLNVVGENLSNEEKFGKHVAKQVIFNKLFTTGLFKSCAGRTSSCESCMKCKRDGDCPDGKKCHQGYNECGSILGSGKFFDPSICDFRASASCPRRWGLPDRRCW